MSACHQTYFLTDSNDFKHWFYAQSNLKFPTIQQLAITLTLQLSKQRRIALLSKQVTQCDQKQKTNPGLKRISAVMQQWSILNAFFPIKIS